MSDSRQGTNSSSSGPNVTFSTSYGTQRSDDNETTPRAIPSSPEDTRNRRRSSVIGPTVDYLDHLIKDVGGVNSIDNFARSWTRAVGFHEIARSPVAWSVFPGDDQDEEQPTSATVPEEPIEEIDEDEDERGIEAGSAVAAVAHDSIDYGTSYNSLGSRLNDSQIRHAGRLFRERHSSMDTKRESEPLLVRKVSRQDSSGKIVKVNVVVGQSTIYQTTFNAVNVLIGIGLLSLPLGIRYAGWLVGMGFLVFSAIVTNYTAKLLAKCLDTDPTLITYADIAYAAYGQRARIVTSIIFFLELVAACVALVVLFADSLSDLVPAVSKTGWKVFAGLVLTPLSFMPLRILSFSSILGIFCCLSITLIVVIDGLVKPHGPGSLREPAATYMFPKHWQTIPLSLGLLMSPWGGHSVFPNIYKDMRHPYKYSKSVDITYSFTFLLDLCMAIVGYLMFGDDVRDEITSNIVLMKTGYPHALSVFIVIFIAIIPITKAPLNARPIISTAEILFGLDSRVIPDSPPAVGRSALVRGLYKIAVPVVCNVLFVILAILVPDFDRIMALMGSAMCFSICVILPLAFYLKIFEGKVSMGEKLIAYCLMFVCSIMAVVGTIASCLPREKLGS